MIRSFFGKNDLVCGAGLSEKVSATLIVEYLRDAFKLKKHQEDHIATGSFPDVSIFTILSGNSGCHKECWGNGNFLLSRLLSAGSSNPYFPSSNTIPTRMVHKDKGELGPIKFKLVSGQRLTTRKSPENAWPHEETRKQAIQPHE